MYKKSKDYGRLFDLLCQDHTAVAFADYNTNDKTNSIHRDICQLKRWEPFRITIACRGRSYGDIWPFHAKEGSELEVFCRYCESANLEWILP